MNGLKVDSVLPSLLMSVVYGSVSLNISRLEYTGNYNHHKSVITLLPTQKNPCEKI
jgi:hypothetical protein